MLVQRDAEPDLDLPALNTDLFDDEAQELLALLEIQFVDCGRNVVGECLDAMAQAVVLRQRLSLADHGAIKVKYIQRPVGRRENHMTTNGGHRGYIGGETQHHVTFVVDNLTRCRKPACVNQIERGYERLHHPIRVLQCKGSNNLHGMFRDLTITVTVVNLGTHHQPRETGGYR